MTAKRSDLYAGNPLFKEAYYSEVHKIKLYMPAEVGNYHTSRYLAMQAQNVFSSSGATSQYLEKLAKDILRMCNDNSKGPSNIKSDVGTLMNNLLYRLKYPIDEDCALRMGAIACFLPDEKHNEMHDAYTQRKMALVKGDYGNSIASDPEMHTFFLTMGLVYTPSYKTLLDTLTGTDYFNNRREILNTLLPASLTK